MRNQQRPTESKPTGLIVSHEPGIRRMLVEILSLENYPTETAANGEEGLALLHEARGSRLVLLQLGPFPDTWELIRLLHENRSLRAHHRIILVDAAVYVEQAQSLEPDDVLVMPFTLTQVIDVLERNAAALRHRKSQ